MKFLISEKDKKLVFFFLFLFVLSFLVLNWKDIYWIFSWKFWSIFFEESLEKFLPTEKISSMLELLEEIEKYPFLNEQTLKEIPEKKEGWLEIPQIQLRVPIVFPKKSTPFSELQKTLNEGVLHFPQSALPGQKGQTIILGHSAPPGWPKIKYQWVFSRLNELNPGDKFFIYFNDKKYSYGVRKKLFLIKSQNIPQNLTKLSNIVILITCWPPGKDYKRLLIIGELENI